MNYYDITFAVLDTALSYITISYLFSAFCQQKRLQFSPVHLLGLLAGFLCTAFAKSPLIAVITTFSCALIYSWGYILKWYNRLFLSIVAVALSILSEMIVGILMMALLKMSFDSTVTGAAYFIGLILSRFIAYVITFSLKVAKHKIFEKGFQKKMFLIFVLPVATVLICLILFRFIRIYSLTENNFVVFVFLALLILSNVFIFYFIDDMQDAISNKEKLAFAQELIKQQQKQYAELYSGNNEIRKMRHNFQNFLLGVKTELEHGNVAVLEKALNDELTMLNESAKVFVRSGNNAFDALVSYKVSQAQQKGITFEFSFYRMGDADFSNIDLSILLGNALDNAIEATEQIEDKQKRKIEFSASCKNSQVVISILNPTVKDIDTLKLTTQKTDIKNHGFGIFTMNQIAQKYGGTVLFSCEDKIFETTIYLNSLNILEEET